MKLLLHVCCAPCGIFPLQVLARDEHHEVTGFFYNPNIHPSSEMLLRRDEVARWSSSEGLRIIYGEYEIEKYFEAVRTSYAPPARCEACWRMRLECTARYASSRGYDAFTSTLLVSPYQDFTALCRIGAEIGAQYQLSFLARDFREGFRVSHRHARDSGMYCQKYCGCVFSERDRYRKRLVSARDECTNDMPHGGE